MICGIDSYQKVSQYFEDDGIKNQLNTEHEDNLLSTKTAVKSKL